MATKTMEWRPGPTVCRCCLAEGCYKDISTEYFWMGKREVYAEMLSETFSVSIAYSTAGGPNSNSRLICEPCISRLRDASEFKRQVQECEKTFMQHLDPGSSSALGCDGNMVNIEPEDVKVEAVKVESRLSDDEFDDRVDFGDDDDDDLDDEPLTKFATKVPKKESVDILDLLDNSKAAEKRKSSTKIKATPAKKTKKEAPKPTSSKPKPEKKKKGDRTISETSIWQMTVAERKNAAAFILNTTVRPFTFMGSSFKCFYCMAYYSEIPHLLDHTSSHTVDDADEILEKYVPKGKRTLQVDISNLKCRLCLKNYSNLDSIRDHLICEHGKEFCPASNGMTEYDMEIKNGMLICHICGKEFHNFALLNCHMNCHVGKVVCENCGAGFLNQHLLMKHKETHLTKRFSCKMCEKIFFKKSQLKYHTEIIHKGKDRVKPKKCPECSQTFKEHYSKMVHLKEAHGISKTFQCHICKAIFSTRRALTEHTTRFHTEKYKCDLCLKCFGIESKLKQHMRGHTGERNFICPICKNAYMHKITLRKHMRIHNSVFKFVCSECGSGFHNKSEFVKHNRQWHSFRDVLE
ncbi:zinc finger protein 492-like isoform X18 [Galleria mellonella]|uniref:Zinc finger protein 492-like isoform X18 n=1 Tax=Galleria mellonella TaxID=7137 RepID=A0ABM3N172_GALME|nr:zinc finger protein 492-like isoform X18 [Galleria mellonella]